MSPFWLKMPLKLQTLKSAFLYRFQYGKHFVFTCFKPPLYFIHKEDFSSVDMLQPSDTHNKIYC